MTVTFGALAPPLRVQIIALLKETKREVKSDWEHPLKRMIEIWDQYDRAVFLLRLAEMLTDKEVDRARKRLAEHIDAELMDMTEESHENHTSRDVQGMRP